MISKDGRLMFCKFFQQQKQRMRMKSGINIDSGSAGDVWVT